MPPFFVQPDRPRGAALPQVFDLYLQGCGDPRKRVGEGGDQRTAPQIAKGCTGVGDQRRHDIWRAQVGDDAGLADVCRNVDLGTGKMGAPPQDFRQLRSIGKDRGSSRGDLRSDTSE